MRAYFWSLLVLVFVFAIHLKGMDGLYIELPYFDIIVHALGGIGIGLAIHAMVARNCDFITHKRLTVVFGVLCAGLIWESFEAYFDIASHSLWSLPYLIDTAGDLVNDVIGGVIVAWFAPPYADESKS